MSEPIYECSFHKCQHVGTKRESFQQELHSALLNASMYISMMLYKRVNGHCHCPVNYAAFDTILATSEYKDPKHSIP